MNRFTELKRKTAWWMALASLWAWPAVAQEGLKVGDPAPDFTAVANNGDTVRLSEWLRQGPVVLFFYRGSWCPYCNRQMSELQDSLGFITSKGARVVGVTPETEASMQVILGKSKATFPLVHDEGYAIMDAYGVSFRVDAKTRHRYRRKHLGVAEANGNTDYILPVPATYVIGSDGRVRYVYFNTDYRHRASVKEIAGRL